jgi:pimeloyl-ACP methyl ester carboxylesterase
MEPFYFGPPSSQLFGAYYPAGPGGSLDLGVVVCRPFGDESLRCHATCSSLARRLCAAGIPVLAFDYFGCGDSCGADGDGGVARWIEDIGAAIDELAYGSGVAEVCLVGVRLGANLALEAAARSRLVRRAALWDALPSAHAWAAETAARHAAWTRGTFLTGRGRVRGASEEAFGFAFPSRLAVELRALDARAPAAQFLDSALVFCSGSKDAAEALRRRVVPAARSVDHHFAPAPPIWSKAPHDDGFGGSTLPAKPLETIVDWIVRQAGET